MWGKFEAHRSKVLREKQAHAHPTEAVQPGSSRYHEKPLRKELLPCACDRHLASQEQFVLFFVPQGNNVSLASLRVLELAFGEGGWCQILTLFPGNFGDMREVTLVDEVGKSLPPIGVTLNQVHPRILIEDRLIQAAQSMRRAHTCSR